MSTGLCREWRAALFVNRQQIGMGDACLNAQAIAYE